jgi:hypothetical protein
MGIAGHTPNFTAAGTILPFSCVEATTTDPFKVVVATAETDIVLGVTDGSTRAFDSTNNALAGDPVVLQNSEFLQLRAGGTIAIGDGLCPTTNGAVITATTRIQFVACEAASSGEILWAQRVGSVDNAEAGVYGSSRAGAFLRDVMAGNDSVDIVVFGDSNAGSPGVCGYTYGWSSAMAALGAPNYATPLHPCDSEDGGNERYGGMFMQWNGYIWNGRSQEDIGFVYSLTNRIAVASDTDATALNTTFDNLFVRENTAVASSSTTLQLDAGASSVNNAYTGMFIGILSGAVGSTYPSGSSFNYGKITAYNGTTKTATVSSWSVGTPSSTASFVIAKAFWKPASFNIGVAFVPAATTYTSFGGGTSVRLNGGSQLASGPTGGAGVSLQYRLVYGKFATTGGTFRLRAMKGTNTLVAGSATDIPTSGGTGYATEKLNFSSSNTGGAPDEMKCAWSGYNTGTTYRVTGPFAAFYHSVIRRSYKGFSVSCLNYFGGATTELLADLVEATPKYLESYLKELRERQIEAGGSGRVVWWHNSGINGSETGSTWTTNAARIRDAVYSVWVTTLGYPATDLSFVMSVTHPVVAGDPGAGTWDTSRPAVAQAAANWATTNSNDGKNVTVVDIASILTAQQIRDRNLYQNLANTLYAAHLRSQPTVTTTPTYSPSTFTGLSDSASPDNGYTVITTGIIRKLIA